MTVFGITIPGWYPYFAGVVFAGLVLYLVVDVLAARHRADEERERDDDEPRHAEPSEVDTDYGVGNVEDETLFFAAIRGPLADDPFAPAGSEEAWRREWAAVDDRLECIFRSFDAHFYDDLGEWAPAVREAEAEQRRFRHQVECVAEATAEYPMLELIGAR